MSNDNNELRFDEVAEKYPYFPRTVIRKIDTALRGVILTDRALERAREENALFDASDGLGEKNPKPVINGALFRDGTLFRDFESLSLYSPPKFIRRGVPYSLDAIEGRVWLLDEEEPVEEVDFFPIPEYYGKKTSHGTPMISVASSFPPDCLNITVFGYCNSWKVKKPCKYCNYVPSYLKEGAFLREGRHKNLEDIRETVEEALKEKGRWSTFRLTGGSDPRGDIPYEREVEEYLTVLEILRKYFRNGKVPCRLVASAFAPQLCRRLADAGATAYEPHIEVWDERLFEWICPSKAEFFGRQYWIDCAIQAVDIFGWGNVCTQFIAGVELAKPYGFKNINEAIYSTLEGAEFFARHGVTAVMIILWVAQGSVFFSQKQQPGPLEYYVRLAQGLHEIRKKYRLTADFNDYRRCAVHPDADLARLDYNKISNA